MFSLVLLTYFQNEKPSYGQLLKNRSVLVIGPVYIFSVSFNRGLILWTGMNKEQRNSKIISNFFILISLCELRLYHIPISARNACTNL